MMTDFFDFFIYLFFFLTFEIFSLFFVNLGRGIFQASNVIRNPY